MTANRKNITVAEMESYFSKIEFTDDVLVLNSCTEIFNIEKFVSTHLQALKANSGIRTFQPYYDRLVQVYLIYKDAS